MKAGILFCFRLWNNNSENEELNHAAKRYIILFTPINYLSSPTEATQERHLLKQPKKSHELT
jgi:hypothetical protein